MLRNLVAVAISIALVWPASASQFGTGNESGTVQPYAQLYAAGIRITRIMADWSSIERTPGVYDWSDLDAQVYSARAAGVIPYVNVIWAPAHASGGAPAYEPYTRGCTEWDVSAQVFIQIGGDVLAQPNNGGKTRPGIARVDRYIVERGGNINVHPSAGVLANDGSTNPALAAVTKDTPEHGTLRLNLDGGFFYQHNGDDAKEDSFRYYTWNLSEYSPEHIHFEWETYDWCRNPPPLDTAKVTAFARALSMRYRGTVGYYGLWNEPEYGIYYPPRDWSGGTEHVPDLARYQTELLLPFLAGIRGGDATAKIVGPETDSPDVMRALLIAERDAGARWFDVLSWHSYAWGAGYPAVALDRLEAWLMPAVVDLQQGRPLWVSETGPDAAKGTPAYYAELLAMTAAMRNDTRIEYVIFLDPGAWFTDGEPNGFYTDFQRLVTGTPRRRAVGRGATPRRRSVRPTTNP